MKSRKAKKQDTITKVVLKEELEKGLEKTKKEIRVDISLAKFDLRDEINDMEERMGKKFDNVMTGIDGVMKELETMREENVVGAHRLRDHEKRITALEDAVSSTP